MSRPKGFKHTEETKENIRQANMGHALSKETKEKIRQSKLGCKLSEEHKIKISKALKGKYVRENNSQWKGGINTNSNGYILVQKKEHPHAGNHGYVLKHRLVMEEFLGRHLKPEEVVHHKNKICDDNRIENLELFESKSAHMIHHNKIVCWGKEDNGK